MNFLKHETRNEIKENESSPNKEKSREKGSSSKTLDKTSENLCSEKLSSSQSCDLVIDESNKDASQKKKSDVDKEIIALSVDQGSTGCVEKTDDCNRTKNVVGNRETILSEENYFETIQNNTTCKQQPVEELISPDSTTTNSPMYCSTRRKFSENDDVIIPPSHANRHIVFDDSDEDDDDDTFDQNLFEEAHSTVDAENLTWQK